MYILLHVPHCAGWFWLQFFYEKHINKDIHKLVAISMPSVLQQEGILPIQPDVALQSILKNPQTRVWGILSCFPFQTGSTVEDHLNLLAKPSAERINMETSLSTVNHL